jgi:hypothetical protein
MQCNLCGMKFTSYTQEAKHRHNAPLLCKKKKIAKRRDLASTDPQSFMELNGIKPVKGLVKREDYEKEKVKPNARINRDTK